VGGNQKDKYRSKETYRNNFCFETLVSKDLESTDIEFKTEEEEER